MLIEFSVGNYLSFKNIVTLSMVASSIREHSSTHVIKKQKNLKLLKSAIIYGSNASGKSNLFKALSFMSAFVQNSSKELQVDEEIDIEKFRLNVAMDNNPSFFEVVFFNNDIKYRYGFTVTKKKVISEWLLYAPKKQEIELFERTEKDFKINNLFKEGKDLASKTRENALFLSVVAQFNGDISGNIVKWFKRLTNISGLNDHYKELSTELLNNDSIKDEIVYLMKQADLGIEDIKANKEELTLDKLSNSMPKTTNNSLFIRDGFFVTNIKTFHKKYDSKNNLVGLEEFDMNSNESQGTKKLFSLLGPILQTLGQGNILLVDEFDSRLHTLITRFIIKLFNSDENNPHNAQLIISTHDTNLLSNKFFRRDQIWFTEKDSYGATDLYSLVEYPVRNDASFEKDYLLGKYGAIPFIGKFDFSSMREGNK